MQKKHIFLAGGTLAVIFALIFSGTIWRAGHLETSKNTRHDFKGSECWEKPDLCPSLLSFRSMRLIPLDPNKHNDKKETIKPIPTASEIREKYGSRIEIGEARPNFYLAEALFRENKNTLALKHLRVSAEIGLPEAQYRLAEIYETGSELVERDVFESYVWYVSSDTFFAQGRQRTTFKDAIVRAEKIEEALTAEQLEMAQLKIKDIYDIGLTKSRELISKLMKAHYNRDVISGSNSPP